MGSVNAMNELTKSIEKSARKVQNQISVLNTIRIYEQISQVEIASATGLQPSTVSNLCRELKSLGQIRYSGKGKSGKLGGKKSDLLSLSQDYGVFSAVYIETDRVKSAIVDFAGNMIEESRFNPR
jgi:DNA-binding Lrp family transcriptional regulator